jgi:uncharacterized membrane protein
MEAKAKLFGHAVHPALVAFPIGLLGIVPIFDVVQLISGSVFWARFCFWLTLCGLIGGLTAAVFGFVDWYWGVPRGTRAHRIGLWHLLSVVTAVGFFAVGFAFRVVRHVDTPLFAPLGLDLSALILLVVGGWLGGELVQQHGLSINPQAHLNAPSSLDTAHLVRREEPPGGPREPQPA